MPHFQPDIGKVRYWRQACHLSPDANPQIKFVPRNKNGSNSDDPIELPMVLAGVLDCWQGWLAALAPTLWWIVRFQRVLFGVGDADWTCSKMRGFASTSCSWRLLARFLPPPLLLPRFLRPPPLPRFLCRSTHGLLATAFAPPGHTLSILHTRNFSCIERLLMSVPVAS